MTKRILTILTCLAASSALAHDTWILPASGSVRPGTALSFDITSGMAFPALDHAIATDRLAAASFRLRGKTSDIPSRAAGAHALKLTATLSESGIAVVWAESKPRFIELKPEQVKEYLEEIGAWDTVGREWQSGSSRSWREIYTKHAKTFVAVGSANGDASWAEPVRMRLEIVPEADPTRLRSKAEFSVRLLRDGLSVSDFPVGMVEAGQKTGVIRKTNSEGRVSFTSSRRGWVLIRATDLKRSDSNDADWKSDFSTLTVWVN